MSSDDPTTPQPPEPTPAAPAQWPAAASAPGYPVQAPAPQPAYASGSRTSSNAIVALVLSVVSWAVCPVVAAIVALVFASMASKEIDASGGQVEGRGLVTAARIVSWVNIGVTLAALVVGAFVVVVVAIAGGANS